MSLVNTPRSLDTLYETAEIIVDNSPADEYESIRATLEYLYHADLDLSADSLRTHAPCTISHDQARNIVLQLHTQDILTSESLDEVALRAAFTGAAVLSAQPDQPENRFLATMPDDPALDDELFEPLLSGTVELIQSAEEEVVLLSPFLSKQGLDRLKGGLLTACGNGADIILITNSLTYDENEYNCECARELLAHETLGSVTTCYEYVNDDSYSRSFTFHAKLITVDSQAAYLGSANLTRTGLGENLELGVVLRDDTAKQLGTLINQLMRSQFIYQVQPAQYADEFVRV